MARAAAVPATGWLVLLRALTSMVAGVLVLLAGCATRGPARDGPEAHPPAGLERVPDAVPRVEPLRSGGPNKPYEALGRTYVPMTQDLPWSEAGGASWYGRKFHGKPTASGENYDMYAMTAAHRTLPIPSYVQVRNPANGREVILRINDRGPFADGRIIDLSYTAALKLGLLGGVAPVQLRRLTHAEIRAGSWASAAGPAPSPPVLPPDDPAPGDALGPVAGWWLQIGAFRQRDGAMALQQRVLHDAPEDLRAVVLVEEAGLVRVQVGPFATREQAQQVADRLRALLASPPLLLERR